MSGARGHFESFGVTLHGPNDLRAGPIWLPDVRRPGAEARDEVLLRVRMAGVCGTDLALASGAYAMPLPLVLGHEFVATVEDASRPETRARWLGKRVVAEINNSCLAWGLTPAQHCELCRRQMPRHCLTRTVTGIVQWPGAFARHVVVPGGNLREVPETISDDAAVFIEPLAAALRTFELTPVQPGQLVVVLGCGRLGRLIALVARRLGARVIGVGRGNRTALERVAEDCEEILLTEELPGGMDALRERVLAASAGAGADVVIEATGDNAMLAAAQMLVRPQGTVALKSTSGLPAREIDTTMAAVHELRFQTSRCGEFQHAIDFLRAHDRPSGDWITARFPLTEAADAIQAAKDEPKVAIDCG